MWETDNCRQDKKVVIVHGRDLLLNDQFPDKFRKLVNQKLEARGVELVLGDYVATFPENDGGEVVFRSGKKLQANLVVRSPVPFQPLEITDWPWECLTGSDVRAQTEHRLDIRRFRPNVALTWGFCEDVAYAAARVTPFDLGRRRYSRFSGRKEGGQSKGTVRRAHSEPLDVLAR